MILLDVGEKSDVVRSSLSSPVWGNNCKLRNMQEFHLPETNKFTNIQKVEFLHEKTVLSYGTNLLN